MLLLLSLLILDYGQCGDSRIELWKRIFHQYAAISVLERAEYAGRKVSE